MERNEKVFVVIVIVFAIIVIWMLALRVDNLGRENKKIEKKYWDEVELNHYVIHVHTDLVYGQGGNGELFYFKSDYKNKYLIVCDGGVSFSNCTEGQIEYGGNNANSYHWINITYREDSVYKKCVEFCYNLSEKEYHYEGITKSCLEECPNIKENQEIFFQKSYFIVEKNNESSN